MLMRLWQGVWSEIQSHHSCGDCAKKFNLKQNFSKHVKVVHGENHFPVVTEQNFGDNLLSSIT